jgi:DNA-binding transcriptional regulator YiaG
VSQNNVNFNTVGKYRVFGNDILVHMCTMVIWVMLYFYYIPKVLGGWTDRMDSTAFLAVHKNNKQTKRHAHTMKTTSIVTKYDMNKVKVEIPSHGAIGQACSNKKHTRKDLTAEDLKKYFEYSQSEAANLLGISVSTLKRVSIGLLCNVVMN